MDVRFRPIVEDDFQTLCDLISSEEELFLVYAQGKHPLTVPQVRELVDIRMEPTVMEHADRVVGFANFYGYKEGKSVVIGNVVVDPSLRGKGLGRRLVSHMVDLAFDRYDLPSVRIHVYNRNLGALLLYGAMDFKPYAMKVKTDYAGDPAMMFTLRLRREAWRDR